MPKLPIKELAAAGILWLGLTPAGFTADIDPPTVHLSDLPPAAQQAVRDQLRDGRLNAITRNVEDGEVLYDVEIVKKAKTRGFTINDKGALLELEVFLPEIPPAVRKAIRTHAGKAQIGEIDKIFDDGEVTYDVELIKDDKTRDLTLSEIGELLEIQVFLDELPAAVQKAVQKSVANGKCGDFYKSTEDGEDFYDVEVETGGKSRTLTFDSDGTLVSEEQDIGLSESPAAVQQALIVETADGKLSSLQKVVDEGGVKSSAALLKGGKRVSLLLDPQGKLLPPAD